MSKQMTGAELELLCKQIAFRVYTAMQPLDDLAPNVRAQAEQVVMSRVGRFRSGEGMGIDGDGLVTEIPEPGQTSEINTSTNNPTGEGSETV